MCKVWPLNSALAHLSLIHPALSLHNVFVIIIFLSRTLSNKLQGVEEATSRAQSLPIMLCHGKGS